MIPTFWPNSERTTCVQVHTKEDSKAVARIDSARRIAYSVRGKPLEIFEIPYTLAWVRCNLPFTALEVYGGDWSDILSAQAAKDAGRAKVQVLPIGFQRKNERPETIRKFADAA
jgi:hypothetical protein